jgi:hypothetical protein
MAKTKKATKPKAKAAKKAPAKKAAKASAKKVSAAKRAATKAAAKPATKAAAKPKTKAAAKPKTMAAAKPATKAAAKPKTKAAAKPKTKAAAKPAAKASNGKASNGKASNGKASNGKAAATATPVITRSSKLAGATGVDPGHEALAPIIASHPGAAGTDGCLMLASIELDGHLDVDNRLFVIGDVKVTGAIRINEMTSLFVGGNVVCANFFAEGDFQCTELKVADTLFGNYEAGITMAQKASGKLWLAGSHDFEFEEDDFEDKHELYNYQPSEEKKTLPAGHKLSPAAVEMLIDKPQAYWENKGPGVNPQDWWNLLVSGGAST